MASSARLNLPLLAVGQAQKEVTHNEALQLLEMLVQPVCAGGPENTPAPSPQVGQMFLCGDSPVGAWAGHAHALALWTASGWRFVGAFDGMEVGSEPDGQKWQFREDQWLPGVLRCSQVRIADQQVIGARTASISNPQGGDTLDVQARAAVAAMLDAMRAHGLIAS